MEIVPAVLSLILITGVFLSRVNNDFWIYKILEYPRLQKLVLVAAVLVIWIFFWPPSGLFYQIVFGALCISFIYLVYKIVPYTFLHKKEVRSASAVDAPDSIRIFAANVLQSNNQYQRLVSQIKNCAPDLVFLVEVNQQWIRELRILENDFPHRLEAPQEDTYGLVLYSKFKLADARINRLVKKEIPSAEILLELPSGKKLRLWGLHPEPPVPGENLYSTAKDKELMKVALKARDESLPCIVVGDLNDVAWSHTTELFRKVSGLLDPRRGRGFYSTFSAHNWFIRYPLDYIFCSSDFRLAGMKRLPPNGSDHFATITHLVLSGDKKPDEEPHADREEMEEAREKSVSPLKEEEVSD